MIYLYLFGTCFHFIYVFMIIGEYTTKGNAVIESKKVTFTAFNDRHGMRFYQLSNGTYGSKVHWAVLTEGDIGVTQWIPAASERVAGIKNLCSFKRIVDAGFTYAMEYKEDGHIGINLGALNVESSVPEKDMFGLVYDDSKRYVLFIDDVDYGYEIDPNTNTMYINVKYKDGTSEGIQLVGTKPSKDYIITSKPVKCIVGTYYVAYNPFARIGLYETYELVSWSPAPEDLNYIAKTYTDSEIKVTKGLIESKVSQTDFDALGQVVSNQGTEISQTKTDINLVSTVSGNARLIALAMSKGKMLNRDPEFRSGLNGISVYNNSGGGTVTVERTTDVNLPNQSGYKIKITTVQGSVSPGLGGFTFNTRSRANAVFITRFIAWIPAGRAIEWASNATGNGRTAKWLTNNVGTGDWEEYAYYVKCGTGGTFNGTNYFYLVSGGAPVTWYLAFATVYDAGSIDDTPTKDELKTGITIKPGAINIFGKDISIAGMVTFSGLSASEQQNFKGNTGPQGPQGPQGFLDATAMRNLQNDFATKLGYSSYDQMASYATQGKTIINGGLIRTNLIDATAIVTNALAAGRITTGNITVTNGAQIGYFTIQDNGLYSDGLSTVITMKNSSGQVIIIPQMITITRNDGGASISTSGNSYVDLNGTNINLAGTVAVNINSKLITNGIVKMTQGLIFRTRVISSSIALDSSDCFVVCTNSGSINVTLPGYPEVGRFIYVRRRNGSVTIYGGTNSIYSNKVLSSATLGNNSDLFMFVFDGTYWILNYCGV